MWWDGIQKKVFFVEIPMRKHLGKGREKVKRYDYFLSRLLQVFWHLLRFYNVKSILLCWIAECALIISLQKLYGKTCTVNVRRRREKMPCSKVLNEFRNDVSIKIMLFLCGDFSLSFFSMDFLPIIWIMRKIWGKHTSVQIKRGKILSDVVVA